MVTTAPALIARTNKLACYNAETLLRDVAFVLSMTNRVKGEMVGNRPLRRSEGQATRTTNARFQLASI